MPVSYMEIDLRAFRHNLRVIRSHLKNVPALAVIKANAYGHGAVECLRAALEEGCVGAAVARVEEGCVLGHPVLIVRFMSLDCRFRKKCPWVLMKNLFFLLMIRLIWKRWRQPRPL